MNANAFAWSKHHCIRLKQEIRWFFYFFYLGFTPCKAEQPIQGTELQEKEAQED